MSASPRAPILLEGWQVSTGIDGSFQSESVATFDWNRWQGSTGISGNLRAEYAVEGLRSQLLGPQPTPLEKLLVDRICICWLAIQPSELHAAKRFNERAVVLTPSE